MQTSIVIVADVKNQSVWIIVSIKCYGISTNSLITLICIYLLTTSVDPALTTPRKYLMSFKNLSFYSRNITLMKPLLYTTKSYVVVSKISKTDVGMKVGSFDGTVEG